MPTPAEAPWFGRVLARTLAFRQHETPSSRSERNWRFATLTELLIILGLVLANGVFAGAEIAVVTLRKGRIEELAHEGHHRRSALALMTLRDNPERFLATVQVGITVVGATAAAFGGSSLARHIEPYVARIAWLEPHRSTIALALVIGMVSYLSIVIGELVPKSLALRAAETYALWIGRPLLGLSWFARPAVWLLSASANVLLRPFGDKTTFTETRYSAQELQELVEEAARTGTIHPGAGEIASRALDLPELTVYDVMVPRQEVVMLSRSASSAELERILATHTYSRMPVYDGNIDNIVGYLALKDLLSKMLNGESWSLASVLRPVAFVPESKPAVELLHEMRERHQPFAVVVDEQGGTSGIVTLEDLVEELVGEIFSEHVQQVPQLIERQADGTILVSGSMPVREVNRALDLELPDTRSWTTIAGLCLAVSGRVPTPGETLRISDELSLEIVDASPRRVRKLRIHLTKTSSSQAQPSETQTNA